MANFYQTITCANCGSQAHEFIKKGKNANRTKMKLQCKACGKTFLVDYVEATDLPLSEAMLSGRPIFTTATAETVQQNETESVVENNVVEVSEAVTTNEEVVNEVKEETVQTPEYATLFDQDGKQMKVGNLTKEELIQFANQANLSIICVDEQKQFYRVEPKVNHTKG